MERTSKDSLGRSREFLVMWKLGSFSLNFSLRGEGFVSLNFSWKGKCVYLENVYSSSSIDEKRMLWNCLKDLERRWSEGAWIVGGL